MGTNKITKKIKPKTKKSFISINQFKPRIACADLLQNAMYFDCSPNVFHELIKIKKENVYGNMLDNVYMICSRHVAVSVYYVRHLSRAIKLKTKHNLAFPRQINA